MNDETPIDEAHDWTHFQEFREVLVNPVLRNVVREAMDLAQYCQNCVSNGPTLPPGKNVHKFDRDRILESARWISALARKK